MSGLAVFKDNNKIIIVIAVMLFVLLLTSKNFSFSSIYVTSEDISSNLGQSLTITREQIMQ